jgi:hypothetical protein
MPKCDESLRLSFAVCPIVHRYDAHASRPPIAFQNIEDSLALVGEAAENRLITGAGGLRPPP